MRMEKMLLMITKHLYAINIYCKDKKINFGHISKDE